MHALYKLINGFITDGNQQAINDFIALMTIYYGGNPSFSMFCCWCDICGDNGISGLKTFTMSRYAFRYENVNDINKYLCGGLIKNVMREHQHGGNTVKAIFNQNIQGKPCVMCSNEDAENFVNNDIPNQESKCDSKNAKFFTLPPFLFCGTGYVGYLANAEEAKNKLKISETLRGIYHGLRVSSNKTMNVIQVFYDETKSTFDVAEVLKK